MLPTLHVVTFIIWFMLMFASYRIQSWVKRYLMIIGTTFVLGVVDALITAYYQAYTITNGQLSKQFERITLSPWGMVGFVAILLVTGVFIVIMTELYGPSDEDEGRADVQLRMVAGGLLLAALACRVDTLSVYYTGPFAEVSREKVETVLYDIANPDTKGFTVCPEGEPCVTPADFGKVTDERMFSYSNKYYGDGTRIEKQHDFESTIDTSIDKQTYDRFIKGQPGEMRVTKVIEITTVRHLQHEWFPFITATTIDSARLHDAPKFHVYHAFTDEIVQKYYVDKYRQVEDIYNYIKQHKQGGQP